MILLKRSIALFFVCSSLVVSAQSEGTISGQIFSIDHRPLEFLKVMLYRMVDSSLVTEELTDEAGKFSFQNVEEGSYFMTVQNDQYYPLQNELATIRASYPNYYVPEWILLKHERSSVQKDPCILYEVVALEETIDTHSINSVSTKDRIEETKTTLKLKRKDW